MRIPRKWAQRIQGQALMPARWVNRVVYKAVQCMGARGIRGRRIGAIVPRCACNYNLRGTSESSAMIIARGAAGEAARAHGLGSAYSGGCMVTMWKLVTLFGNS